MTKAQAMRYVREHGVTFIKLWFTDLLGFAKSFTITADELEIALEGKRTGILFPAPWKRTVTT